MRMTINCDMGEGFGLYRMGNDAALMPLIDLANVACGFHASDPSIMRATVRLAKQHGVARNRGFRGARSFAEPGPFRALFRRMIADAPAGCLVMCHPGFVDLALSARDPVTESREAEYRYFASEEFSADLAAAGLRLARLGEALAET